MMVEIVVAVPNAMMMGTMISMIVGIVMCGLWAHCGLLPQ
tara:strand:- start:586 stop:705 length:120 start_codon:yes stop_codon:yes gene_type:complete